MPVYEWIIWIALFFVLISIAISVVFSNIVLYSKRQPIVKTPAAYGMPFEDVAFPSSDGLKLKGWFIPASGDTQKPTLILTHPLPFNRHGFLVKNQGLPPLFWTDVDLLKTAQALHQEGYPLLMFDFRNHGESEGGVTGIGLNEYQDVLGAVQYVESRGASHIGFVSFCMGANSTIVALSKGKERLSKVQFLVAIQPVSATVFFHCYLKNVYTPLSLYLIPLVNLLVKWRGGHSLEEMSPIHFVHDIGVPTLYVQAREDPWTELSDITDFYNNTPGEKELWLIEGKMGRFDAYNYVGEHPKRILEFIQKHSTV